jgi:MSHA biogenesis protein MshO
MTIPSPHPTVRQRGFTLVEAIVVMVITGILAGTLVLFIRRPVQNYADAAARADLSDTADLVLRRMARELRAAVPNSVRWMVVGGVWYVEFIPTKAGGQYLATEDNVAGNALSFANTGNLLFDIAGTVPGAPYAIARNDFIVIYNLGADFPDADAYAGGNRAQVDQINGRTITMVAPNPFAAAAAAGRVPNSSPDHRFQVAGTPVTFRCEGAANGRGTLRRFAGYGFPAAAAPQQVVPPGNGALMANNVLGCDFTITQTANQQSGVIGMTIALARTSTGAANGLETVTLTDQIHVDNTP